MTVKYEFDAVIKKVPGIGGAYVEIPFDVREVFVPVDAAFPPCMIPSIPSIPASLFFRSCRMAVHTRVCRTMLLPRVYGSFDTEHPCEPVLPVAPYGRTYEGVPCRGSVVKMGTPCHTIGLLKDIRRQIR